METLRPWLARAWAASSEAGGERRRRGRVDHLRRGRPGDCLAIPVPEVTKSGRSEPDSAEPRVWMTLRSASQLAANLEKSWLKARWMTASHFPAPVRRESRSSIEPGWGGRRRQSAQLRRRRIA